MDGWVGGNQETARTRGGTAAAGVSLVKACVSSLTWLPGAWLEKVAWMPTMVVLVSAAVAAWAEEGAQEVEEAMSRFFGGRGMPVDKGLEVTVS